jgi:hypothetical protein
MWCGMDYRSLVDHWMFGKFSIGYCPYILQFVEWNKGSNLVIAGGRFVTRHGVCRQPSSGKRFIIKWMLLGDPPPSAAEDPLSGHMSR